ncbi:MAG: pilus assembly protein TadG-related protein [Pseudomonadota bacterium]|nr:pilus assembly protein TadG-related protein [Pseudomonadota bacterium]
MAVLVALAMPVLVGMMGIATETSYWYVHKRGMQNAADAAAIAVATTASSSASTITAEAQAVVAGFFPNGLGTIKVTATYPNTCPDGTVKCYNVTVSDKVPLFLSQVITGNKGATALAATAVASSAKAYPYCILALGGVTKDITSNGAPKANLKGCNTMSNTGATCNGSNLNANVGDAHGTNNGCGVVQNSNVPVVPDPYAKLASNIPANTCGGKYPQEPAKKGPALPLSNQWSGSKSLSGYDVVCGDQQLTADTTISAPSNAVLVIENGRLDTNGFTLKTTSGSGLTIVFTGDANNGSYQHYPSGSGTLDIAAPTSGTWSGMALYQDPNLTDKGGNLDISYAGNNPTWDISGMVYLPNSSVTFSGAVNKASNGLSCFGLTVGDITINGTADILSNTQCAAAGVTLSTGGSRGTLVN